MKEILEYLGKPAAFHIATVDEFGNPQVRPFSFVMEWDGKLTFATGKSKAFCRQIRTWPRIAISSFDAASGEWFRLHGVIDFTDDITARKKVFEVMPELEHIYPGKENEPELACFYVTEGKAAVYTFASPEPVKEYNL